MEILRCLISDVVYDSTQKLCLLQWAKNYTASSLNGVPMRMCETGRFVDTTTELAARLNIVLEEFYGDLN